MQGAEVTDLHSSMGGKSSKRGARQHVQLAADMACRQQVLAAVNESIWELSVGLVSWVSWEQRKHLRRRRGLRLRQKID